MFGVFVSWTVLRMLYHLIPWGRSLFVIVYSYKYTRAVRKVKNVCAYNPRSFFIVPDQSFGVFSRV